jgi:hypothetical protein
MDAFSVEEIRTIRTEKNRKPERGFWLGFSNIVDKIDISVFPFHFYRAQPAHFNCRFYNLNFQISANRGVKTNIIHVDFTLKGKYSEEIYGKLLEISKTNSVQQQVEDFGFIFPRTFGTTEQDRTFSTRSRVRDSEDKNDWDNQYEWMKSKMIKAYELFGSETQRLCSERY